MPQCPLIQNSTTRFTVFLSSNSAFLASLEVGTHLGEDHPFSRYPIHPALSENK
jgi:hypothetical protein